MTATSSLLLWVRCRVYSGKPDPELPNFEEFGYKVVEIDILLGIEIERKFFVVPSKGLESKSYILRSSY
jgi:hypothetical protein